MTNSMLNTEEILYRNLQDVRKLVEEQANDEGLWFNAQTAPEAYLQRLLRRLHAAIENI